MILLKLEIEEVNAILQILGELPTKTGAWILLTKIKEQANPQVPQSEPQATETVSE
jgi:hypothetical protein